MNEIDKIKLTQQAKHVDLNKCTALHNALALDQPDSFTAIGGTQITTWTEEQRKALTVKYYELLLSL